MTFHLIIVDTRTGSGQIGTMTQGRFKLPCWIERHPLLTVILIAIAVRAVAVVFSKGFIHSDDHYDTVMIAYDWLRNGFWGANGFLRWRQEPSDMIGRFPLYVMSLWAMMKALTLCGVQALNSMMYVVRAVHAAISLIPVWVAFKVTVWTTQSKRWGMLAALVVGLNFMMPFLGVRNLIEMVGGNIWMLTIIAVYQYERNRRESCLVLAGLAAGLAWMIRFQMASAAIPIPFILWWQYRSVKPALSFAVGVAVMLFASGLADLYWLGRFGGSTITNITMNAGLPALYKTIPGLFPLILLLALVPPWSFVSAVAMFRKSFLMRHAVLVGSSFFFVLFHLAMANQQERFVFPIIPAFLLMSVLAVWHKKEDKGYVLKSPRLLHWLVGSSVVLDLVLLIFLTPGYGHKGLIEPVVRIRAEEPSAHVLFIQPGIHKWIPISYGGEAMSRFYVREWDALDRARSDGGAFDYVVLLPRDAADLNAYEDSARTVCGAIVPDFEVAPSCYDWLLHKANPHHNPDYAAFVYKSK
ncbi:MAG TPA: hypothetical protein PLF13_05400 [candidate division Zixibacteria bacterium]|nr:hypothetical protein [candidate division Zixibacteria bacterium]